MFFIFLRLLLLRQEPSTCFEASNGSEVTIKVDGDKVMVDNAIVTKTDIKCGNGVIHVIDAVILPK